MLTAIEELSPRDLFEAAHDGDGVAQPYLTQLSEYNAMGIAMLSNAYDPDVIALGGGVALNNPAVILEGIREHLEPYMCVDPLALRITLLGDDIGLYGALARAAAEPPWLAFQDCRR